ncbi:hypothetical protein GCM10011335_00830 [Aureimonas glaciei]|uniref:Uncharacterized protein n=1 Tax=Aureimonas glaciei TaxID=1776957 RepID=A0A916XRL6_9HYPH|nr:hypothetical protein GCM10011335_00830 [Aureimonas glaciei]
MQGAILVQEPPLAQPIGVLYGLKAALSGACSPTLPAVSAPSSGSPGMEPPSELRRRVPRGNLAWAACAPAAFQE